MNNKFQKMVPMKYSSYYLCVYSMKMLSCVLDQVMLPNRKFWKVIYRLIAEIWSVNRAIRLVLWRWNYRYPRLPNLKAIKVSCKALHQIRLMLKLAPTFRPITWAVWYQIWTVDSIWIALEVACWLSSTLTQEIKAYALKKDLFALFKMNR